MMEEIKKNAENPWGRGDELEAELKNDPVEYGRMLLERNIEQQLKKLENRKTEISRSLSLDVMMRGVEEVNGEMNQIIFCRTLLDRLDSTVRDHYGLDGAGRVIRHRENTDDVPDLLSFVRDGGNVESPTAETVRQAAFVLSQVYPEIHFEFNQTHKMIEYTATIRA